MLAYKKFWLLSLFLVAWSSPAAASTVCITGDSHAVALSSFVSPTLSGEGHRVEVDAFPGWSAASFRSEGRLPCSGSPVDVVVVIIGGNNRAGSSRYRGNLSWFLAALRRTRPSYILWFGPPVADREDVDHYHRMTSSYQAAYFVARPGVVWHDSRKDTKDLFFRPDRVHFTADSYRTWAQRLMARVTPFL